MHSLRNFHKYTFLICYCVGLRRTKWNDVTRAWFLFKEYYDKLDNPAPMETDQFIHYINHFFLEKKAAEEMQNSMQGMPHQMYATDLQTMQSLSVQHVQQQQHQLQQHQLMGHPAYSTDAQALAEAAAAANKASIKRKRDN
jgi:hypothetical protein